MVGFAAQTDHDEKDGLAKAATKVEEKQLDFIYLMMS